MSFGQFFQDSTGANSMSRLVFFCGVFVILGLAICQFFGLGTLATALYGILSTLVSGGYIGAKYFDTKDNQTLMDASLDPEATNVDETN